MRTEFCRTFVCKQVVPVVLTAVATAAFIAYLRFGSFDATGNFRHGEQQRLCTQRRSRGKKLTVDTKLTATY